MLKVFIANEQNWVKVFIENERNWVKVFIVNEQNCNFVSFQINQFPRRLAGFRGKIRSFLRDINFCATFAELFGGNAPDGRSEIILFY